MPERTPEPPGSVDDAVRAAELGALRSLVSWLTPLFVLFTPFDYFLSGEHGPTYAILDLLYAGVFGSAALFLRRGTILTKHAHIATATVVLSVLPYTLGNLWIAQAPVLSGGFVLWLMGISLVLLSWPWLVACLALGNLVWLLMVQALPPSPDWGQWGFIMATATAISIAAHTARLRTVRGLHRLRLEERQWHEDMRAANESAQEAASLRSLNRMKTEFMNHAAHELATPLTPLLLEVSVLEQVTRDASGEVVRSVQAIDRNVKRLQVLVGDLLDSAKVDAGRMKIDSRQVDLAVSIREIVAEYRLVAEQQGVHMQSHTPAQLKVQGDGHRIHQVLANLLSNALKFTPLGGTVRIEAKAAGDMAEVRIVDTGRGIAETDLKRLFQPFVQVGEPARGGLRGTGLGLYISRGIVELHGGHMGADSPGKDGGATFWFTLPLARQA